MYYDLLLSQDAKDNMKDIKTKDEDFVMDPLGGKAISGMFLVRILMFS